MTERVPVAAEKPPAVCPACHNPFADRGTFTYADGKTLCYVCHQAATPKRLERWGHKTFTDFMTKMHAEMRQAVEDRSRARREAETEKARIRNEVRAEVVEQIRRLSFRHRLRLLFNPFGTEVPR